MFSIYDEKLNLTKKNKNVKGNEKCERLSYVFEEYEIKHLQNMACNEIGFPTTIIESDEHIIDSTLSEITYRQTCHILRYYLDGSFCKKCDVNHAKELFNIDLTKSDKIKSVRTDDGNEVMYYEYRCPYLGYRELMFPIIYKKKVLAVFLVGTRLSGDDKQLTQTKKIFLKSMIVL